LARRVSRSAQNGFTQNLELSKNTTWWLYTTSLELTLPKILEKRKHRALRGASILISSTRLRAPCGTHKTEKFQFLYETGAGGRENKNEKIFLFCGF